MATNAGYPIYWARQLRGRKIEVTKSDVGVYVRYLTGDASAGDPRAIFLTIGTYPRVDAYRATLAVTQEPGAKVYRLAHHGVAVARQSRPTSVYVAYPRSHVQVEVYDPDASHAWRMVTSGRIKAINP